MQNIVGGLPFFGQLIVLCLKHHKIQFSPLVAHADLLLPSLPCCLVGLHLLISQSISVFCACVQHYSIPDADARCTWHFPLLSFLRILSAQFSILLRFVWMTAQPSCVFYGKEEDQSCWRLQMSGYQRETSPGAMGGIDPICSSVT